jgi:hypothetical protein
MKRKAKSMLIIPFDIKGFVHKEFDLIGQTASSNTTETFSATARKRAKTSPRTLATKELAAASRQRTVSHFPSHHGVSDQTQHDCRPHSPYFSLLPRLKIKLKGRHFDTIEVMEAESQAVLNTLREHDFQDVFKNGRRAGNGEYARMEITSSVIVASRTKVSF